MFKKIITTKPTDWHNDIFIPFFIIRSTIPFVFFVFLNGLLATEEDLYYGVPTIESYPHSIDILDNEGFAIGYCETRKAPAWVAYRLFPNPGRFSFDRPSRFKTDSNTKSRITHDHYTRSGFDRGHLAPDYAIMIRYGQTGQLVFFLMSNVAPMTPSFNQGI